MRSSRGTGASNLANAATWCSSAATTGGVAKPEIPQVPDQIGHRLVGARDVPFVLFALVAVLRWHCDGRLSCREALNVRGAVLSDHVDRIAGRNVMGCLQRSHCIFVLRLSVALMSVVRRPLGVRSWRIGVAGLVHNPAEQLQRLGQPAEKLAVTDRADAADVHADRGLPSSIRRRCNRSWARGRSRAARRKHPPDRRRR